MKALYAYLAAANVITALLYGADKAKAGGVHGESRSASCWAAASAAARWALCWGCGYFTTNTRHWYFTAINTAAPPRLGRTGWRIETACFLKKLRCSFAAGGVFAAGHGNFCWCIQ